MLFTIPAVKAKLIAFGAALLTLLAFFARFKWVEKQRDTAIKQRDAAVARADQAEDIAEIDTELENEFAERRRESDRESEDGKMPDHIRRRNDF